VGRSCAINSGSTLPTGGGAARSTRRAASTTDPRTVFFTPDTERRGFTDYYNQDHTVRLTWQATPQQKFTGSYTGQSNCNCHLFVDTGTRSPEAALDYPYNPLFLAQGTWTYTAGNRLLLQAGATYVRDEYSPSRAAGSEADRYRLRGPFEELQLQRDGRRPGQHLIRRWI